MIATNNKSRPADGLVSYKDLLKWEVRELARILGIRPSNELRPLVNQVKQLKIKS